jgi:hypothetical protein
MSFGDSFVDASLYQLDEELTRSMSFVQSAIVEAVPRDLRSESGPSRDCGGIYLRMMYLKNFVGA